MIAGVAYVLDTVVEAIEPGASPGFGVVVPALSLVGFPAFWMSLRRQPSGHFASIVFVLGMLGIAGLAPVTFINNRIIPRMPKDMAMELLASIRPELIVIGVVFLVSALLLFVFAWRSDKIMRVGAGLYAVGAIPVSLPPLMPPILVETGGLMVASAMLIWGWRLLSADAAQRGRAIQAAGAKR